MLYKSKYETLEVMIFEDSEAGVKAILKALGDDWRRADLDDPSAGVLLKNDQLIKPGEYLVKFPNNTFYAVTSEVLYTFFFRPVTAEERTAVNNIVAEIGTMVAELKKV